MAVANPQIQFKQRMTEAEFLRLPNDGKYELVNGEANKLPASSAHDVIGIKLAGRLLPLTEDIGYLAGAQAGFRMANGNIRCPDLSLTLYSRYPLDDPPSTGFWEGAPDLCIEIISPSETSDEMQTKVEEYFESGAKVIWQLFPERREVNVFVASDKATTLTADEELDGGDLIPDFRCRVRDLFDIKKRVSP